MRVVMPLFDFQYFAEQDFAFSDGRLSIRGFENPDNLVDRKIFSEWDRQNIRQAHKVLVVEAQDLHDYDIDASLLLMTFRILSDNVTPMIKYRLSDDEDRCSRIVSTETHIRLPGYRYEVYAPTDFPKIDAAYMTFRQAEPVSLRLKNAFAFPLLTGGGLYHWDRDARGRWMDRAITPRLCPTSFDTTPLTGTITGREKKADARHQKRLHCEPPCRDSP